MTTTSKSSLESGLELNLQLKPDVKTLVFLAVQNSSIGDLVTDSLSHSLRTLLIDIKKTTKE